MNIDALLAAMTLDVYARLRQAVETGKWPDGTVLSEEQRDSCMQAVLLYQSKIEKSSEHMTINAQGEIVQKNKREFRDALQAEQDENTIARFKQDDI